MSDRLSDSIAAAFGPTVSGVPLWEGLIVLAVAVAAIAVALRGRPMRFTVSMSQPDRAEIAVVDEIREIDKAMGAQANGVLTLSTIAAGAFATIVQTHGGPGVPLSFATSIALLTCSAIAALGLALTGEVTGAAALPTAQLHACVEQNLRRVHRRTQCVRVGTWCLFPSVLLVVICIAAVRG